MSTTDSSDQSRVFLGGLIVAAGGVGVAMAAIGMRYSDLEPVATAFWRFFLATPLIWAFARLRGYRIAPLNLPMAATGVFFGLDIVFWHLALDRTSVANATFIVNLGAILSGLVGWWVLKKRPSPVWPIAALFALLGAATMTYGGGLEDGVGNVSGDLLALTAATFLTGYFVCISMARDRNDVYSVVCWATFISSIVAGICGLMIGETMWPHSFSALGVPLFLAVVAQCLGQGFVIWGAGMCPPSVTGLFILMQPIVAMLLAWPLFDESLNTVQLVGAGSILFGMWIAGRK